MREEEARAILCAVSGVSYGCREMALRAAESTIEILSDPMAFAPQLGVKGASALRRMLRTGVAERLLERIERTGVQLVLPDSPGYPPLLRHIAHPPHLLFVQGRASLDDAFPFAVVGTRRASDYGAAQTRAIAGALAEAGMCVVSGMALGIDACAHRGALDAGGRTVAVLGGALDKPYPPENLPLMREIERVIMLRVVDERDHRARRQRHQRVCAGCRADAVQLFAPQPDHRGHGAGRAGHGRRAPLRGAAHGAGCAGERARGLCAAGPGGQPRLPAAAYAACRGRAAGNLRAGHPEYAVHRAGGRRAARGGGAGDGDGDRAARDAARSRGDGGGGLADALAGERDFDELCAAIGLPSDELGAVLTMMDMDGVIRALPGLRYALA